MPGRVGAGPNARLWALCGHLGSPAPRAGMAHCGTVATRGCGAEAPLDEMSEMEKFMFDLQGYLIVPGFLAPQEVDAINAAFDANWHLRRVGADATKRQGYDQFYGMLEWEQPHCQIFRDLLAHPKLVPYLNTLFGRGWKADHEPFMLTGTAEMSAARESEGDGGMSVHGGTARHFGGATYYEYNNGQIRNGMSNCIYILKDIEEGDGGVGFVPGEIKGCIHCTRARMHTHTRRFGFPFLILTQRAGLDDVPAGSHKANYETPKDISQSANYGPIEPVVNPAMKAGDLVIFTEATLHCTLPWTNPQHETRRYVPTNDGCCAAQTMHSCTGPQ